MEIKTIKEYPAVIWALLQQENNMKIPPQPQICNNKVILQRRPLES